jgi:hypothetical protein
LDETWQRCILTKELDKKGAMMKGRKGGITSKLPFVVVGVFCLVIIIGFVSFMQSCAPISSTPSSNPPATTTQPPVVVKTLSLKVTKATYNEFGYLEITGVLTNTCTVSIFSPTIKLEVYSSDGKVLLADDSAWAAGTMLEDFLPGSSAAIDFYTSVSGQPKNIKWLLSCKDANLTIVHAEK